MISWSDPLNCCKVLSAEVLNKELLLLVHVLGTRHEPEEAEIIASGSATMRFAGRAAKIDDQEGHGNEYTLVFDCPATLQCAEDVMFSYAIGYDCVPILDLILSSLVQSQPSPNLHSLREATRNLHDSSVEDVPAKPSCRAIETHFALGDRHRSTNRVLQPLQAQQLESFENSSTAKKTEGIGKVVVGTVLDTSSCTFLDVSSSVGCEAFFKMVEDGHDRTVSILEQRLREIQTLSKAWIDGDMRVVVDVLEQSKDDALLFGAVEKLQSKARQPMPARALARLLPLMQRLSQSNCEAQAVAAMRFSLQAIEVSWPAVTKALKNVSTPRDAFDECQAALQSASSFYNLVKTMSRSVRISKTNGPLVPVCKKLKASLEQALISVGRLRGAT